MKKKPLTFDEFLERHTVLETLFCVAFVVSIIVAIATTKTTEPTILRAPEAEYSSIEEEYIATIDRYLKNGIVAPLPKDSVLSINERTGTISITDIETGSRVDCDMVLNNTIPIYKWTHSEKTVSLGELILRYFNRMLAVTLIAVVVLLSMYGVYLVYFYIRNSNIKADPQDNDADTKDKKNFDKYPCDTCSCSSCETFYDECQCTCCFNGDKYTIDKRTCHSNNNDYNNHEAVKSEEGETKIHTT